VDHGFSFYFNEPVERIDYEQLDQIAENDTYFCFRSDDDQIGPALPFQWQPLGLVSSERHQGKEWTKYVIVGKVVTPGDAEPTLHLVRKFLPPEAIEQAPADQTNEPIRIGDEANGPKYH